MSYKPWSFIGRNAVGECPRLRRIANVGWLPMTLLRSCSGSALSESCVAPLEGLMACEGQLSQGLFPCR